MTHLYDLVDQQELEQMIEEGRISKQVHPHLPIHILNYTARAQYMNKWTNAERVCRGLILEDDTLEVIARGPSKFFNYGQPGSPELDLDSWVTVSRKEDGSLGIGWTYDGHYGVATRGSFMSDQARFATDTLLSDDDKANIDWAKGKGYSRIWEIVYPSNRIVLDYGDRSEIIPLGTVSNETGLIIYRPLGIVKDQIIHIQDALRLPIPPDEEGYVLDLLNSQSMVTGHVKLKGEEYKILHGLLTNTNARRIWVQLAARACHHWIDRNDDQRWATLLGHDPEDFKRVDVEKDLEDTLLTNVPDEFYDWVTKKIDSIQDRVSDLVIQGIILGGQIAMIDDRKSRWDVVKTHPLSTEIMRFADSRDESTLILKAWKLAKPEGDDTPFRPKEED